MDGRQRAKDLFDRGYAHEMRNELAPARQLLEEALTVALGGGVTDIASTAHELLGVVDHKEDRLDDAEAHLREGLRLALDVGDGQCEAYARQELGFLLLDREDPAGAVAQFRRALALAPSVGIMQLAGNALSGTGVAFLDLGRLEEAIPSLQAALSIRTEIGDLEQQHIDLIHLARAALLAGQATTAAAIARFLAASPETAGDLYGHDRRALQEVLTAVDEVEGPAATGFDEARRLVATLTPGPDPS